MTNEKVNDLDATRVALVAMHSEMGDPEASLARVEHWCQKAHTEGAQFVLFPEECVTGSMNKSDLTFAAAHDIASRAAQISIQRLEAIAARWSMTLAVGTIEPVGDKLANSLWVVGPGGYLDTFRKLHLPNPGEREWFIPGDHLPVIRSQGWTFGVGICYDARFGEIFRAAAQRGAEFYLLAVGGSGKDDRVTADGDLRAKALYHRELAMQFLPARAVDNGIYVFYANQAGRSGNAWFPGLCLALDPKGYLIDEHLPDEGMIVVDVSRVAVKEAQEDPCALSNLRPEVYADPVLVG